MSKYFIGLGPVAAILLAAAPLAQAVAQDRDLDREPSVGKIFNGDVPEGGGTARYLLTLQPGQAIDLTAVPVGGSDPVVRVYDAATGTLIAENDDSAGSLAANVRLYSAQRQRVRIEVANASVEDSNAAIRFDLILRPTDYRPSPPVTLTLGESRSGTLARGDEQLFRFEAERGQLWDLSFAAAPGSELDPALTVHAGDVAGGEVLGEDDDGGGGLNARLRFLAPRSGTYTVRAYGVGQSEGAYVFAAGRAGTTTVDLKEIGLSVPARGSLESGQGEHMYRLSDEARRRMAAGAGPLVVELRSTGPQGEGALDPILEIGFETPLGFSTLLSDDDGGEDMNSRLVFDGSGLTNDWLSALRIKAKAYDNTAGAYELVVSQGGDG